MKKRIEVFLDRPRVLLFRHKDLREAVNTSHKTIGDLISDPFGGWPYLLQHGLRHQDTRLTLDDCSGMIERWVDAGKSLKDLGDVLIEGVEQTGFIKIQRLDDDGALADPQAPTT